MPPPIRFAVTEDDVSIAYTIHGNGPPLIFVRGWISHLDLQWLLPDYRLFMEALGRHFTVVRFDCRGNGLSERNVAGRLSLDDLALDVHAVVGATELGPATFLASCYGGPIFARFARQAPEQVSRVMLDGTYARGEDLGNEDVRASVLASVKLLQTQPGAAMQTIAYYTDPDFSDPGQTLERRAHFGRDSIKADVASELYSLSFDLDATKDFMQISAPTLVTHRRDSKSVPVELGRRVASLVPGALFATTNGRPHNPWDGDATEVLQVMGEFLGVHLSDGYHPRINVRPTVVLFSDIVQSTNRAARLGDSEAQTLVRAFFEITRQCLELRGGRLVKSMGDGAMAAFPSVSQAIGCAVDMQEAFNSLSAETPERGFQVRIGINAGEPVSEDDDLHGLVVATAARICDQGLGGEILVSNVVRELAIGKGFDFVDRGWADLRGIGEPVHLFRVDYLERVGLSDLA